MTESIEEIIDRVYQIPIPPGCLSLEEIAAECLEIQKTWSKRERRKRAGSNDRVDWKVPRVVIPHRQIEAIERIAELSERCVELAGNIRDEQRLERIATIAEWCGDAAERIASEKYGNGEDPDFLADVASVAWEIGV